MCKNSFVKHAKKINTFKTLKHGDIVKSAFKYIIDEIIDMFLEF